MQTLDLEKEMAMSPILRQAYRPMFLFGAIFSVVAMAIWGLVLGEYLQIKPYANVVFWHQHEMIYGFVSAIIAGFLLTAVQNWTRVRATHGDPLLWMSLVWLAGRLMMLFGGYLPAEFQWVVMLVDMIFLPLVALYFGLILYKADMQRNMFFVPILLLLAVCNLIMHLGVQLNQYHYITHGSTNGVWLVTLVMGVITGRVLPMFTANGTATMRVQNIAWLDKLCLGSLWLIFALHFFFIAQFVPSYVMALVYAVAAVALFVRLARLRFHVTLKTPLVWSLHIAVFFIPVGLAMFALKHLGVNISHSTATHSLTAGAMGVMILSMMARVSLGHSGRPLIPKKLMTVAFVLIIVSALLRIVGGGWFPMTATHWYLCAIAAWVVAYGTYVAYYFKILTSPRVDGRPG